MKPPDPDALTLARVRKRAAPAAISEIGPPTPPRPPPPAAPPLDQAQLVLSLGEIAACCAAVLRAARGDPGTALTNPDKLGVLLERAANAMTIATECLARLEASRRQPGAVSTPPHPLAGTLAAIRRAQQDLS